MLHTNFSFSAIFVFQLKAHTAETDRQMDRLAWPYSNEDCNHLHFSKILFQWADCKPIKNTYSNNKGSSSRRCI